MSRLRVPPVILFVFCVGSAVAQNYTFTNLVGTAIGADDGVGRAARFSTPYGIATDRAGNTYVADTGNYTIRKIDADGRVTTLAGVAGERGSTDGVGGFAHFFSPQSVAVDASGNVYVADGGDDIEGGNQTIRKISPSGIVTTIAGTPGVRGSSDGIGAAAQFGVSLAITVDATGNLYVSDHQYSTIRKVTPAGEVTTVAGLAGVAGSTDGTGAAARFNLPLGLTAAADGNIYIVDLHGIRRMSPDGAVTTVQAPCMTLNPGRSLVMGLNNHLYVADWDATIKEVALDGTACRIVAGTQFVAGTDDGVGASARLGAPHAIAVDSYGDFHFADTSNDSIRKVTPDGVVTTTAGGFGSPLSYPLGVAIDPSGVVYVADTQNYVIRKVESGNVTVLAGAVGSSGYKDGTGSSARFASPSKIVINTSGDLFVLDSCVIRRITPDATVSTFAGTPGVCGSNDGFGTAARLNGPSAMAIDSAGNLYVSDQGRTPGGRIRKISADGFVSTIADNLDGFELPRGIAVDRKGNVFTAGFSDHLIEEVTPDGLVIPYAGAYRVAGDTDGARQLARFRDPSGLATDAADNLYVTDQFNGTIRKITPDGIVSTIGGSAGVLGEQAGTGIQARFTGPMAIASTANGTLCIADINNAVVAGAPALPDAAAIDAPTGVVGATRQLDVSSPTATSWSWFLFRQPSQSSASIVVPWMRNPTFTPDAEGLYTFRLTASNAQGNSITYVNFMARASATSNATTTSLTATLNPSPFGGATTLVARVRSATALPSGIVDFKDGGTLLGSASIDNSGFAAWTTSSFGVGPHGLTASYRGDAFSQLSESPAFTQVVKEVPSVTIATSEDIVDSGDFVTLTAKITGTQGVATGTVVFSDSFAPFATAAVDGDGQATWTGTLLRSGSRLVAASYNGDATYWFATSSSLAIAVVARPVSNFNTDSRSDLVVQNSTTDAVTDWLMSGDTPVIGQELGIPAGWSAVAAADLKGDRGADIILQNRLTGDIAAWIVCDKGDAIDSVYLLGSPGAEWRVRTVADFDRDHRQDLVLQSTATGAIAIWLMDGATITAGFTIATPGPNWQVVASGDFNGDGNVDLLLQNSVTRAVLEWRMIGPWISAGSVLATPKDGWQVIAAGDFDGDGRDDILLQNSISGTVTVWLMNGFTIRQGYVVAMPPSGWIVKGRGDYNGDGTDDFVMQNSATKYVAVYLMNAGSVSSIGPPIAPANVYDVMICR